MKLHQYDVDAIRALATLVDDREFSTKEAWQFALENGHHDQRMIAMIRRFADKQKFGKFLLGDAVAKVEERFELQQCLINIKAKERLEKMLLIEEAKAEKLRQRQLDAEAKKAEREEAKLKRQEALAAKKAELEAKKAERVSQRAERAAVKKLATPPPAPEVNQEPTAEELAEQKLAARREKDRLRKAAARAAKKASKAS